MPGRIKLMSGLRMENIKKIYDKNVLAVNDFNMEVFDKEFIVMVGPSGCGKTTMLRMIAGLESITEGGLYIGEDLVNHVEPKDRDIAMVFQNYALYPHMSVYDNMAFALKLRKIPKNEIRERVRSAAQILGIEDYLGRKPKALSGGQRQRVAIGRAIVREPKVFLMDEPLSNLDAKLRNQMRTELIKLHQRLQTTFIYVTHDQVEAMTLGDRIVVMKDGLIQLVGERQHVFYNPVYTFVAGFIGTPQVNFIRGAMLTLYNGAYCLDICGQRYRLPEGAQKKLRERNEAPREVIVGIRPEHVLVAEDGGGAIPVKAEVIELMGSEYHLHTLMPEGTPLVLKTDTSRDFKLRQPQELCVKFKEDSILVFDVKTEENILN